MMLPALIFFAIYSHACPSPRPTINNKRVNCDGHWKACKALEDPSLILNSVRKDNSNQWRKITGSRVVAEHLR